MTPILPSAAFRNDIRPGPGLLLMAPLAIAGVALINTGLGRSRSAAQALLGNLAIVAVTAIVFALVGATFTGDLPAPGHIFTWPASPGTGSAPAPGLLSGLGSAGPVPARPAL
jgi:hypothetical protein